MVRDTDLISRRHLLVSIRLVPKYIQYAACRLRSIKKQTHLVVDIGYLLYSTTLARQTMCCRNYTSVCTLSEFLDELIFGINDECRVERSECMSLHINIISFAGRYQELR